eukprot:SAG31_NODE_3688_length_3987_cov_2.818930_2_plen_642_part_00
MYTRICCAALVLPTIGPAADATRLLFRELRTVPGEVGGCLKELVLQPDADSGGAHLTVVAVSTELFGEGVTGLRATHRPSAQDLKVSTEVQQTLVSAACALIASRSGGESATAAITFDAMLASVLARKMNYWKFARVSKPVPGAQDCLDLGAGLAICGDYFGGPGAGSVGTFGSCVRSAAAAAEAALDQMRQPRPQVTALATTAPTAVTSSGSRVRRVLIAGGGLTGALTAHRLKQAHLARGAGAIEVIVYEMARGAGGRMSTTRWGSPVETRANTGAQYISAAADGAAADLVQDALAARLLEGPLSPSDMANHFSTDSGEDEKRKEHFRATCGTSAIVKHFLASGADAVAFETRLQSLTLSGGKWIAVVGKGRGGAPAQGGGWVSAKGGAPRAAEQQQFDAVVLAMPPKDASRVRGDAQRALQTVQEQLRGVDWYSRFSMALWFAAADRVVAAEFVAAAAAAHQATTAKGESESVLDAVVVQPSETGSSVAVVIQSTSKFWKRYSGVHAGGGRGGGKQVGGGVSAGQPEQVVGGGRDAVQKELIAALRALAPSVPMPTAVHVKMLNWRTSQVKTNTCIAPTSTRSGGGAVACLVTSHNPLLVLAGDWLTESSFEGCAISAAATTKAILATLEQSDRLRMS